MAIVFGNNCNLKCKMCGCKGYLTRLGLKKISRLNKKGLNDAMSYFPYIDLLFLSGGEPLLYREFKETVEVAAEYPNLKLKTLTNGNLINDFWVDTFCEIPFKYVVISLDAATKKTYNTIRVKGKFDKVLKSIQKINSQKDGKDPEVHLAYVIMKRNQHEVIDFLELAHSYGISKVSYQAIWNARFMFYFRENVTSTKRSCFKLLKLGEKLQDLSEDYGIDLVYRTAGNIFNEKPEFFYEYHNIGPRDLNDVDGLKCERFWKRLDISPTYFTSCVFSVQRSWEPLQYYSQNKHDAPKMRDIWNCKKLMAARKLIADHQFE